MFTHDIKTKAIMIECTHIKIKANDDRMHTTKIITIEYSHDIKTKPHQRTLTSIFDSSFGLGSTLDQRRQRQSDSRL